MINYLWQMFCCLVALGLYQPARFLLGLVASNVKAAPGRKKAEGRVATECCGAVGAGGC